MNFPVILKADAAKLWHLNQQLHEFEHAPKVRQHAVQTRSLQNLLNWSHTHSAFWQERLKQLGWSNQNDPWATLRALAPLTRADLQEHTDKLSCAHALAADSCTWAQSTGSTGRPVRALKHAEPYSLRYLAYAWRSTLWHKIDVSKAIVKYSVRAQDSVVPNWGPPEAWFSQTGPAVIVRSMERNVSDMYAAIKQHYPAYLVANASVIEALTAHALKYDGQDLPRINAVLSTGEAVSSQMRADCQAAFGAKVINRYSCEEIGWLALQCPKHDHMHVLSANVILEIVDTNGQPCPIGQPGRVLVTALHSEAMPLIRYEIGDVAEWGEPCDCGINLPVIQRIWGREREFVRTPNGELRYVALLAEDFLEIAPIRDMRFRLYSNPLMRFEVVCDTELNAEQHKALVAKIHALLGFVCPVDIEQLMVINWGETDKRMAFAMVDERFPLSS